MTGASTDGDRFEDGLSPADQLSLSHLDQSGHARMVDVSGKDVTARQASASGRVLLSGKAVRALRAGEVPKGDALAVARIAGIQAAKKTPDLIINKWYSLAKGPEGGYYHVDHGEGLD